MSDLPAELPPQDPAAPTPEDLSALELDAAVPLNDDAFEAQDDGSYIVHDETKEGPEPDGDFDDNLAEYLLPEDYLTSLGSELCELIEADKEARKDRDKQYAEGIKRTGLDAKKHVGADFDGASSVTHPMLAKGCIDFASRAIKELFPSSGPVRTQIVGKQTEIKLERAERKKTYMNYQLTAQVPEHRPEFEKMLSQLPLGGSQYKRWWWDEKLGRPRTQAVYIDNMFLPFDQNDFYTTPRLTHREFIGLTEYEARIDSGLYRDVDASKQGDTPERSEADKQARDVEGVTDDSSSAYDAAGGTREVYTVYADLEVPGDPLAGGEAAPYIVHIEEHSDKVVGMYRNWAEADKRRLRLHWIVEYNFIPWRGAYAVGLAHLIGSMAVSSTGALNALLDSAHISNFPGGLKLKGGRATGQSIQVNATELQELEAPPGVDDIRKLVMGFPFNGPSAVLYNLLEWLTQQAEIVVSTASEKIADAGANMPMGTALALIEGGSTNFSAIHARLHHSARKELEILHRLDATYLNDQEVVQELGDLVVYRADFQGPLDVLPVSDPNIFSEAQRYAQLQAVLQLESMPRFSPFFKPEKLLVRALRLLQVPYADDIANLPADPQRLPAVDENAMAADDDSTGVLKAYEDQDDLAHLTSHVMFMTSPILGANPLIGATALPKLLKHCKEHLVAYYTKHHKAAAEAFMGIATAQGMHITQAQADQQGHALADRAIAQALSTVVAPGLAKAMQLMQQFAPKPPADGNTIATLASQEKQVQMRLAAEQAKSQQELTLKKALADMQAAAKAQADEMKRLLDEQISSQAAGLEQMQIAVDAQQIKSTEQIAASTLEAQTMHKQWDHEHAQFLAALKARSDQMLVVIKALMAERAPQPQATNAEGEPTGPAPVQPEAPPGLDALVNSVVQDSTALAQSDPLQP